MTLSDLKGKKIRTYYRTLGDFIGGLNASAVTIAISEGVPALQMGVADCTIQTIAKTATGKVQKFVLRERAEDLA